MEDTGERMIPAHHKGSLMYGEHMVRYEAACEIGADKIVLDIASGTGYGTQLLAKTAKHVYGVDVAQDAIDYAKKNYSRKNVTFLLGDAERIPLEDNSVDVVVSFETIEHIKDYQGFLAEIKRVLKPGGQAIVSTPNDKEFPEGNHFHLHEFEVDEFENMLKKHFSSISFYYQGDWLYSGILPKSGFQDEWTKPVLTSKLLSDELSRCIYMFAVCSNDKAGSITTRGVIAQGWSDKNRIEEAEKQHVHNRNIGAELEIAQAEIQHLRTDLNTVLSSKSWRYTQALRKLRHTIRKRNRG